MTHDGRSLREIRQFDFIDALRGWAFLAVFVNHVNEKTPHAAWVTFLTSGGARGVQLFFVVSAFTLFLSFFIRKEKRQEPVEDFFIRRFFRVAPMFWMAALFYLTLGGFNKLYGIPHEVNLWRIVSTFLFVNGWHPNTINNVVPGGWTVAVEMNFYLLLPFFFKHISSLKKALVLSFSLLVFRVLANVFYAKVLIPPDCPPLISNLFLYFWLPNQLPVFSLGIILFYLLQDRLKGTSSCPSKEVPRKDSCLAAALVLLFLLFFRASDFFGTAGVFFPAHFVCAIGFLFLAWALAIRPFRFFVNGLTCYTGKVSYSAYLCHFFVLDAIAKHGPGLLAKCNVPFYLSLYYFAVFFIALVATLFISTFTYAWIEQPFQSLGKKIIRRYL